MTPGQDGEECLFDDAFLPENDIRDGLLYRGDFGERLLRGCDDCFFVDRLCASVDASHGCLRAFWFVTLKQLILR
jgi:hypothetical protein